jgi:hypothetical protein
MKVICINDKKLPAGGAVIKDQEYKVLSHFRNCYEQNVYIIDGVNNEGTTKWVLSVKVITLIDLNTQTL